MVRLKSILQIQNIGLIIIGALLILHNVAGIGFNRYIYLVIFGVLFLRGDKSNIYECLAFMTPCLSGLPKNYIFTIAIVILLVKNCFNKTSYTNSGILCIITIIILEVLSMFRGFGGFNELLSFISVFSLVIMRLIDTDYNGYDSQKICLYFIIGYWVAMICLFGQYRISGYSLLEISNMAEAQFRLGDTNEFSDAVNGVRTNITFNSNSLGLLSLTVVLASLLFYRRQSSIIFLISTFGALSVGFTSLSRAYVLTAILALMAYFFLGFQRKNIIRNTIFLVIVSFIIFYLLTTILSSFMTGFEGRMDTDDVSNGRLDIFSMYNNILLNNPLALLFGVGIQNYAAKLGVVMSAHNGTQEVVLAWGILGLTLIVILLNTALKNAKRYFWISKQYYIPFFAVLFFVQFGQSFSSFQFMMLLFLAFDMLLLEKKHKFDCCS